MVSKGNHPQMAQLFRLVEILEFTQKYIYPLVIKRGSRSEWCARLRSGPTIQVSEILKFTQIHGACGLWKSMSRSEATRRNDDHWARFNQPPRLRGSEAPHAATVPALEQEIAGVFWSREAGWTDPWGYPLTDSLLWKITISNRQTKKKLWEITMLNR